LTGKKNPGHRPSGGNPKKGTHLLRKGPMWGGARDSTLKVPISSAIEIPCHQSREAKRKPEENKVGKSGETWANQMITEH